MNSNTYNKIKHQTSQLISQNTLTTSNIAINEAHPDFIFLNKTSKKTKTQNHWLSPAFLAIANIKTVERKIKEVEKAEIAALQTEIEKLENTEHFKVRRPDYHISRPDIEKIREKDLQNACPHMASIFLTKKGGEK